MPKYKYFAHLICCRQMADACLGVKMQYPSCCQVVKSLFAKRVSGKAGWIYQKTTVDKFRTKCLQIVVYR